MATAKRLFTPGPLCVSLTTKEAMLRDLGSREDEFISNVKYIRSKLLQLAGADEERYTCIPLQGSGTYSIEAVYSTTVPRQDGKVLILENGAYGRRQVDICKTLGIEYHHESFSEHEQVDVTRVSQILEKIPGFTHVGIVHCETSTGIINPIHQIGIAVKEKSPDTVYFVDAMSSFGAIPLNMVDSNIDYLVSSANKCIEGVPGFGYVLARKGHLMSCKGVARVLSFDLVSQFEGLDRDGQFRFTPPTHSMLAFRQALLELESEGGVQGRSNRYKENSRVLREGMANLGFKEYLRPEVAGYIITTFLLPNQPNFDFSVFYRKLYEKGQVIYPGKLLDTPCFRLGNIGHLFPKDMHHLITCIQEVCQQMNVTLPLK